MEPSKLGARANQFEVQPQADPAALAKAATEKQQAEKAARARAAAEEAEKQQAEQGSKAAEAKQAADEAAAAERARAEEAARQQAAEQGIKQEEKRQSEEAARIRAAAEEIAKQQTEQAAKVEEAERARVAALDLEQQIAAVQHRAQEMAREELPAEMEARLNTARERLQEAQEYYDNLSAAVIVMRDDLKRVHAGRALFNASVHDEDTPEAFMAALEDALRHGYDKVLIGNMEQVYAASRLLQQARTQLEVGQRELAEITHDRMELNSKQ